MEGNLLSLDLSVLNIDLITNQANWDAFTYSSEIFVPFGDVFVSDSGADIEHDDSSLASDVVAFSESTKFFLTCGVPDVEFDWAVIGVKDDWVDVDTSCS